jgi:hypothetical protein
MQRPRQISVSPSASGGRGIDVCSCRSPVRLVDDAAVAPDHKIAILPLLAVFVLFLDRMRQQAVRTGLWAPLVGLDGGKEA